MAGIVGPSDPLSTGEASVATSEAGKIELPERLPDIEPLNGKIVVRRFEADSVSKGGIVLPTRGKKRPSEGIVLAVGQGRLLENGSYATPKVKFKDHVLFPDVCGVDVKIDDMEYTILDETEVLAVINTGDREWEERLTQLMADQEAQKAEKD